MHIANFNVLYFMALLLLAGAAVAVLFVPFATAALIAAVLAALLHPMHRWLAEKVRLGRVWASFVSCLIVFFLIVIPVITVAALTINEARGAIAYLAEHPEITESGITYVREISAQLPFLDEGSLASAIRSGGSVAIDLLQKTYAGVSQFFFWLFIFFFSLFYFFIDGERIVKKFMRLSPLKDDQERELMREFVSISRATLKGTVVIGIIQGTLGGLLFAALGVPSPVTWGVVMILLSIIPVLGSGLVWTPVGVAMLFSGQVWQGAVILGFGFGVISTIDNILRPKLVERDSQMHPLLVLFATLGGIFLFGIIGFIIGPIIVAMFLALLRIYEREFAPQLREYNGE